MMLFEANENPVERSIPQLIGVSRSKRYWAAFFDQILAMVCFFLLASCLGSVFPPPRSRTVDVVVGVLAFSLYFVYFFVWEALFSATPGKMWYGLTVCHLDGSKCRVIPAFLRTITRILEVNPILLGYLPAVISIHWSTRKQRLGDMLAGTVVVEKRQ